MAVTVTNSASGSVEDQELSFNANPSGANRALYVGVSVGTLVDPQTIVAVTFNGVAMDLVSTLTFGVSANVVALYRMIAPPTGSKIVLVSLSDVGQIVAGAVSFAGVHQSSPNGTPATNTAASTGPTVDIAGTVAGSLVIDSLGVEVAGAVSNASVGANQTSRWNVIVGTSPLRTRGCGSTEPGNDGTVTMSWTLSVSKTWGISAVEIMAAPPSLTGGTPGLGRTRSHMGRSSRHMGA